jgi:hypothetical protein
MVVGYDGCYLRLAICDGDDLLQTMFVSCQSMVESGGRIFCYPCFYVQCTLCIVSSIFLFPRGIVWQQTKQGHLRFLSSSSKKAHQHQLNLPKLWCTYKVEVISAWNLDKSRCGQKILCHDTTTIRTKYLLNGMGIRWVQP